jgi:hypothetical protein
VRSHPEQGPGPSIATMHPSPILFSIGSSTADGDSRRGMFVPSHNSSLVHSRSSTRMGWCTVVCYHISSLLPHDDTHITVKPYHHRSQTRKHPCPCRSHFNSPRRTTPCHHHGFYIRSGHCSRHRLCGFSYGTLRSTVLPGPRAAARHTHCPARSTG